MQKGIDCIGVTVSFFCHDGQGNFVVHKRTQNCRDEWDRWDFGGGSVEMGEKVEDALSREVFEEYGTKPITFSRLGVDEVFRKHDGKPTHWISFRYKVLVDPKAVINNEPQNHSELRWVRLDDLPAPLHSQVEIAIEKYKDKLQRADY